MQAWHSLTRLYRRIFDPLLVNYYAQPERETPFNLAVARVMLGLYLIWKLASYQLERLQEFPVFLFTDHRFGVFLLSPEWLQWLPWERNLAIVLLLLFVLGWRLAWSSFFSALLIAHMIALHYVVTNSGTTFLPGVYALLLWGIFRHTDELSLDGRRRRKLSASHEVAVQRPADMAILKWLLVILATTYFLTGFWKLRGAGAEWATADNLNRMLHFEALMHLREVPPAAQLLLDHPTLSWLSAVATLVLECGFLLAVLLRAPIAPFILGLGTMHALIFFSMEIFFFDQYLLYLLFVPWDRVWERIRGRRAAVTAALEPAVPRPAATGPPQ